MKTHGRLVAGTISLAMLASACAHYVPRPLDLPATLDTLSSRSLTDPGLAQVAAPAQPQGPWPPRAWDLSALTLAALYFQPDLAVARASWAVARAGIVSAGERPNPNVSAGPGYNSSSDPRTITPWILNLDLDFTIETAGKRRARIGQAQRLSDAERFRIAATAWQVRARVRQSLLDIYSATETGAILERQRDIQASNVALLQRQLTAGAISTFEMTQARITLDTIRVASADAERQLSDARARLAAAIGVPLSALDGIQLAFTGFLSVAPEVPARDATRAALLNRADVLGALAGYEASQSALQLEIARQYPDIHLGPGYQMDQAANKWTMLMPFALPVFSRNRGPIAEAEARRTAAAAQVTAVQAGTLAAIDRALAAYRAAQGKLAVTEQVLAEARTLDSTARTQLAAGDASQLDVGLVEIELAGRELARLEALVQVQQAAGDIEDAMQRPIDLPMPALPSEPK